MTTEVRERSNFRTARTPVRAVANYFEERRSRIPCPRCNGGNMYRDADGEHVCAKCGCTCDPGKVTFAPSTTKAVFLEMKPLHELLSEMQD